VQLITIRVLIDVFIYWWYYAIKNYDVYNRDNDGYSINFNDIICTSCHGSNSYFSNF
jgi:hypothetical protein